jgi:hypothetical protein
VTLANMCHPYDTACATKECAASSNGVPVRLRIAESQPSQWVYSNCFNTKRKEAGEMRVELSDGCVEGEKEVRFEENFYGRAKRDASNASDFAD